MPCYTVTTTVIEFGPKTDAALFEKAAQALTLAPYRSGQAIHFSQGKLDVATGKLTLYGSNTDARATQLRRAYGAEIAKREAARYGWTLQKVPGQEFKYTLNKR